MDRNAIQERVEAFDKAHGESIFLDGWFLYSDGASREGNVQGALMEPPSDPVERSKRIVRFHRLKAEQLTKQFTDRKEELTVHCRAALKGRVHGRAVSEEVILELEHMAEAARSAQARLKEVETSMEGSTKTPQQLEREAASAKARALNESVLSRLSGIKL